MSGHVFKLRMGTKPQKKATVLIPLISGHVFKQFDPEADELALGLNPFDIETCVQTAGKLQHCEALTS